MESSVGKSGSSRTRSLDLKTFYKSKISDKEGNVKKEKSNDGVENDERVGSKKRKSRKEATLSSFEHQLERKKSRNSVDEVDVVGVHSGSGNSAQLSVSVPSQKLKGIALGGHGEGILIPKRPRGSVGRNRFASSHLLKQSAASGDVETVSKLRDELKEVLQNRISGRGEPVEGKVNSGENIVKLNSNSGDKARTLIKQKGVVGSKGNVKQESLVVTSSQHGKREGGDSAVNDQLLKPTGSLGSKDQVGKLKDEPKEIPQNQVSGAADPFSSKSTSANQIGKLNGKVKGKIKTIVKQKGVDGLKGNQKRKEGLAVGSSQHEKAEGGDLVVNNEAPSSKRNSSNRRKRKNLGSGSETVAKKVEPFVDKKIGTCDIDPDDDLEQNAARMLSSRFDPSCTGFASNNITALSTTNGISLVAQATGNVSGEGPMAVSNPASAEAADRVLRPRRQQKGKGTSRKRRHFYEMRSDDLDAHWFLNRSIKIFWPLDESWYYGLVNDYDAEKNLHHIKYDDRDEEWISLENERFKLLLLPSEVPHKPRRMESALEDTHTEGTTEDTESRDLHKNDEGFMDSHMESEPIISWLARSSLRVKSSLSASSKKKKVSHLSSEPPLSNKSADANNNGDTSLLEKETGTSKCSLASLDISINGRKTEKSVLERSTSGEGHLPIVYIRRRYRKESDATRFLPVNNRAQESLSVTIASLTHPADWFPSSAECNVSPECPGEIPWSWKNAGILKLDMTFMESKKFEMCMALRPILTYVLGADVLWLFSSVLLLQYGTIVNMWPTVCLEVLLVDNIVGSRLFLFEGCLKQAVAFIFLVMTVFCEPTKHVEPIDQQMPVTSIRVKLSFFDNFRKQKVFAYHSFSKIRESNWLYLDSEFQPHCLLTKRLSLPECTYNNIKLLEGENQHLQTPYACQNTCLEVLHKKSNRGVVPMICGSRSIYRVSRSRPSAIFSSKHGSLPPLALSFTAAPNFFLGLHLKLLMERGITSLSLQDHDSVHILDHPGDTCQPYADDCSHVEDHFEISSESFPEIHQTIFSIEAAGSGVVPIVSHLGKDAEEVSVDCRLRKSSQHVLHGEVNARKTSLYSEAAKTIPVEIWNSGKCEGSDHQSQKFQIQEDHALQVVSSIRCSPNLKGMSVEIPSSDEVDKDCRKTPSTQQVTWKLNDGIICSPDPTGPKSLWHRNKSSSNTSSFGDPLHAWADGKTDFIGNGFGNGPKKPRTQVQYTLPSGGPDLNSKSKGPNQNGLPYKRIRKANDKKTSDASKGTRRNLELVACDANLLINGGNKGWRERGARVFLEAADHNEWRLAVKLSGVMRYSYIVHQDLQPGSTNRYTYAMMWKGGKDWALEFPDRSQWFIFKEMHEECLNRNIRAASMKTIPIPGVRLIKESVDDDPEDMPFVRSPWYIRQVQTDVEMAMDTSHVLYDMDSDDEEWVVRNRISWKEQGNEGDILSDELFEKIMDVLEKVSYSQQRDLFDTEEIIELIGGVCSKEVTKAIYEHWREKRQGKDMPLIRQLQPPLWESYQQMCKEWEQSKPKSTMGQYTGSQEKASSGDKPPMFAFCLKPRGLELLNKGSKHRPHKKISLSGHSHAFLGDHDGPHSSGRRVHGYAFSDEKAESSDVSPLLTKMYSPRDAVGLGHFSLNCDASDWNHQPRIHRNNSKKIRAVVSPKVIVASSTPRKAGKRNNGKRSNNAFTDWHNQPNPLYKHPGQLLLGGSDLDEFRLRDASGAAKHARNMAKLKRERAQKLMLSADLAIHKAVSALMTAEAIKACTEVSSHDRAMEFRDNERMKSASPPSGR